MTFGKIKISLIIAASVVLDSNDRAMVDDRMITRNFRPAIICASLANNTATTEFLEHHIILPPTFLSKGFDMTADVYSLQPSA